MRDFSQVRGAADRNTVPASPVWGSVMTFAGRGSTVRVMWAGEVPNV